MDKPVQSAFAIPRPQLQELLSTEGDFPKFIAAQLFDWLYKKLATDFSEMQNISKVNRARLAEHLSLDLPAIHTIQESKDGTTKFLLKLHDGKLIETVFIPEDHRQTLCVSTQVGCKFGCKFCRTAQMGFVRNLTVDEIVAQVLRVRRHFNNPQIVTNIVFMGMGEPSDNIDNLVGALKILGDDHGLSITPRKTTVSTVGNIRSLDRLAEFPNVGIALSVNASNDELRSDIMPINRKYSLTDLVSYLKSYPLKKRKRFTLEYVLFRDLNDAIADAEQLHRWFAAVPVKINLIPYNDNDLPPFKSPAPEKVSAFMRHLADKGHNVTVRRTRGRDILAACGQLATESKRGEEPVQ